MLDSLGGFGLTTLVRRDGEKFATGVMNVIAE